MKIQRTGNNGSSPFNRLPDEIFLEILNKLIDLKTLCLCYVVCKRFASIVVQVDTMSFTTPPLDFDDGLLSSNAVEICFECDKFRFAVKSMNMFREVKSFCINLPFPTQEDDNRCLFKWKGKFGNNKLDSYLLLSPNSICYNTNNQEQVLESKMTRGHIVFKCLRDADARFTMLFKLITIFPLLEKVSVIDSAKLGILSVNSGGNITEIRKWLLSPSETVQQKMKHMKDNFFRANSSSCYIPLLKLPVSRYVMKGVTMLLVAKNNVPDGYHSFSNFDDNDDDFEDKEHHAAYAEAVNEIFNRHKGSILFVRW